MLESLLIQQCSQADLVTALKKALADELQKAKFNSSSDSDVLFTKKEAAAFLKVSLPTFSKHIKASKIPSYRVAQNLRFKKSDLLKYLKQVSYNRGSRCQWDDSS